MHHKSSCTGGLSVAGRSAKRESVLPHTVEGP